MRAHLGCEHWRAAWVVAAALVVCPESALADSSFTTAVPAPDGPNQVGTLMMRIVDPVRDDPYLANRDKRELLLRFWYPSTSSQLCQRAEYTSPKVWSYISRITGTVLPTVKTNSCLNAPIANGVYPVIVATHGYTGTFTDYTFIFEDLASRGYVVVSVAHTYETTAVEFPDGRFVKSVFGSHFAGDSLRTDDQSLAFARSVRLRDLNFVLDELGRLNGGAGSTFPGHLDLSRVAIMGHSLGGLVAILSVAREPRFKAAVVLDMPITSSVMGTEKPVLILSAGREQWSAAECKLWRNLEGPRLLVNLRGADHLTPSDAVWLAKDLPGLAAPTGTMGPEKTVAIIRNYIATFLDTALRGRTRSSLLSGPSSEYSDAAVTTQKQPLCGELVRLK